MATNGMNLHVLPRRENVHLADIQPRSGVQARWERIRHRQVYWFVECVAEFTGVFLYVYAGVGSTAAFTLGNVASINGLSSMFQIGVAYSFGIILALVICASTSGGHLNPAVTITFLVQGKVRPLKALRYIVAQILGAYVAALLIYVQYGDIIHEVTEALEATGKLEEVLFTPNGPAGIFALYATPGFSLGRLFLNEFVCDFIIGLAIASTLDPTNFAASPQTAPFIVGFTYGVMVWGYASVGISTNAARDVGTRLMALTIWGLPAGGGAYAAIAALTNIPATLAAMLFYQCMFADSSRVVTPDHVDLLVGHVAKEERMNGLHLPAPESASTSPSLDEKGREQTLERVCV